MPSPTDPITETPFPTAIAPQVWFDVEQLILGTAPPSAQLYLDGWNVAGFALNIITATPPPPPAVPGSVPVRLSTFHGVRDKMTLAEGAAFCRKMAGSPKGVTSISMTGASAFNWAAFLQLLEEILAAVGPFINPTPTPAPVPTSTPA